MNSRARRAMALYFIIFLRDISNIFINVTQSLSMIGVLDPSTVFVKLHHLVTHIRLKKILVFPKRNIIEMQKQIK
jgi:hypothetical protein